jgi:hypothetical protein
LGTTGSDNFAVKVSADGSAYVTAIEVDRNNGRVNMTAPVLLGSQTSIPASPPVGKLALYARRRAGADWVEAMRPNGRDFPLQPHFGMNRIATWSPSSGTTVTTDGMPRTATGTVSAPTLTTTNLAGSMRRWRVTSAATASSLADERSAGWVCWRGNAAGLGGWTYVARLSLATLQPTGMGFFGLLGNIGALVGTQTVATLTNCIGIGFERGVHTNWQAIRNDATGAPTLTDLGAAFPVNATGSVLTLTIYAAPNDTSVWLRVREDVSGGLFETELTSDLPAAIQLLSPRNFLSNGSTAAAVAYDCTGVYIETDY